MGSFISDIILLELLGLRPRAVGLELTEDINSALGTIEEHHPNETIWVQHFTSDVADHA